MYLISELAAKLGLSRTAVLYYEKLKIIQGRRLANGYRYYSEADLQRLVLIQQLQSAGLTLKECQSCLDVELDKAILQQRLAQLEDEITAKLQAKDLLLSLLGERSQKHLHDELNKRAPSAHLNWLLKQGYTEKEALRLRWLSKDMSDHESYMHDFMTVFEPLERWGPGSEEATLKAFAAVPNNAKQILEIGCGKGSSTLLIAKQTDAKITALDNESSALAYLQERLHKEQLAEHVSLTCASMTALPFKASSFDVIWAEGCVYVMGMQSALSSWKPFLRRDGVIVVSDLVWLNSQPEMAVKEYWQANYPDMQSIESRIALFDELGYELIEQFSLDQQAWKNYWQPLKARLAELAPSISESQAVKDIQTEIALYENETGQNFTYHYFILKVKEFK